VRSSDVKKVVNPPTRLENPSINRNAMNPMDMSLRMSRGPTCSMAMHLEKNQRDPKYNAIQNSIPRIPNTMRASLLFFACWTREFLNTISFGLNRCVIVTAII